MCRPCSCGRGDFVLYIPFSLDRMQSSRGTDACSHLALASFHAFIAYHPNPQFCFVCQFSFHFVVCLIGCLENLFYFSLQMIRKQSEIDGSVWMDCGHSFFCLPFALAQEARQLDKKPFKGGSIVPLPLWRRLIKPCFPERVMDKALLEAARKVTSCFLNELFSRTF